LLQCPLHIHFIFLFLFSENGVSDVSLGTVSKARKKIHGVQRKFP
jgi:hypothetical protein